MAKKRTTSYSTNKLTPQELFKYMPYLDNGKLPNIFTMTNTQKFIQLGEHSDEDFISCLEEDIKENIEILKKIKDIVLEHGVETSTIKESINDTIIIDFESGEKTIGSSNWTDIFMENFFTELNKKSKDKLNKIAEDPKDLIKKIRYLKKEVRIDNDVHQYLLEQTQEKLKRDFESLFSDYFSEEVSIELTKNQKIVNQVNPKKVATSYEDAQHTTIFPLDNETKEKMLKNKEKYSKYIELDDLVSSSENKYFEKIEVDLTDSKGDENKNETLDKVIDTFNEVNSKNLTLASKFVFRIRKFGKHESKYLIKNGMYVPALNDKELHNIMVKTGQGGAGAVIHEIGHMIDLTQFEDEELRANLVKVFSSKIDNSKMSNSMMKYYYKPTEVIARLSEVAYMLKYPEQGNEKIRLVKDKEYYETNKAIYFDFENWTEEDKQLAMDFYDIFFENNLSKELISEKREQFERTLRGRREEIKEQEKTNRRKYTTEELEDKQLRNILRSMDLETIEMIFKDTHEKEKKGEYTQFSQVDNVKVFSNLLSLNILNPLNKKTDEKKRGYDVHEQRITFSTDAFEIVKKYINKLDKEDKVEVVTDKNLFNDFNRIVYHNLLKGWRRTEGLLKRMSNQLKPIVEHDKSLQFGMWNTLNEESMKEVLKEGDEGLYEILNHTIDTSKTVYKSKNIIELLAQMTKKDGIGVDITEDEICEEIYNLITKYERSSYIGIATRQASELYNLLTSVYYVVRNNKEKPKDIIMEQIKEEFLIFKKHIQPKKRKVSKDIALDNYGIKLPEGLDNKELYEEIKENPNSKELRNKIIEVSKADKVLEIFEDSLTKEEREKIEQKLEYIIQTQIPTLMLRMNDMSKDNILRNLLELTDIKEVNIENVFRVKVIFEVVDNINYSLQKIKENKYKPKTEVEEGIKVESLEDVLESVEKALEKENISLKNKEELEDIKKSLLENKEENELREKTLKEAIENKDFQKAEELIVDNIKEVLYLLVKLPNTEEEIIKYTKQTQQTFDFS